MEKTTGDDVITSWSGVSLDEILTKAGAAADYVSITAIASDGYSIEITKEELTSYYPEFSDYALSCRFRGCAHVNEPDCAVKKAVEDGLISRVRYDNYRQLYDELKSIKRYK